MQDQCSEVSELKFQEESVLHMNHPAALKMKMSRV